MPRFATVVLVDADGRVPPRYWLVDPTSGEVVGSGARPGNGGVVPGEPERPMGLICADETPAVASAR